MQIGLRVGLVLLAATGAAQAPDGVAVPDRERAPCELRVLMPSSRLPARRALRALERVVQVAAPSFRISVGWESEAVMRDVGRRAPSRVSQFFDVNDANRRRLAPHLSCWDAVAIWVDESGAVSWVETFDAGARYAASDLRASGRFGAHWRGHVAAIRAAGGRSQLAAATARACGELRGRPEYLARTIDAALDEDRTIAQDPSVRAFVDAAFRSEPRCEVVQRVACRLNLLAGEVETARRAAFAWIESAKGNPDVAIAVIETLKGGGSALDGALELVYEVAAGSPAVTVGLLEARFEHRIRAIRDVRGAELAGRELVDAIGADAQAQNSLAWKLLTKEPYAGRLDALALYAGEAMLADPQWRTYWRLDTMALALFRNGRFDEATRMQSEATAGADPASHPRYSARLDQYRAALAMRERPAAGR